VTQNTRAKARRLRLIGGAAGATAAVQADRSEADARASGALAGSVPADDGQVSSWEEAGTPSPQPAVASPRAPATVPRPSAGPMLGELGDEALVALGLRGDVRACERLYRRHVGFALNLAAHIAGSTRDIEDVVHDAFLRAFDNLGELRSAHAFRSWLGSIVVHGMRSRLRRARLLRLFGLGRPSDPVDLESIASPEAPPAARAELAQIYALLQTRPTEERIAWTLRFVDGHDLGVAAELAGCSLATVKRRIRRVQEFLEAHFVDSSSADGLVDPTSEDHSMESRP
jgi:RNA polymerase sigma-70 factor (ECF subfamily)